MMHFSALNKMPKQKHIVAGLCAILLITHSMAAFAIKKWQDENGEWHFGDTIPPEYVNKEHSILNERGLEVERIERAQTKEEIAREKELERLRAEQQRIIEEQQAKDEVLLRTFRTEDDIIMARDGKLAAVDVQIKVAQDTIKRLKRNLSDMQKKAAAQERQNGFVSKRLQEDIEKNNKQIEENYAAILDKEKNKQRIIEKHDEDIERFRVLNKLSPRKEQESKQEERRLTFLENVVPCTDDATCDSAWAKAKQYALKHATTKLEMESDTVIITGAPSRDDEYSITVSRIRDHKGTGAEIFLDLQCRETTKGRDLCKSEELNSIRQGFRGALGAP